MQKEHRAGEIIRQDAHLIAQPHDLADVDRHALPAERAEAVGNLTVFRDIDVVPLFPADAVRLNALDLSVRKLKSLLPQGCDIGRVNHLNQAVIEEEPDFTLAVTRHLLEISADVEEFELVRHRTAIIGAGHLHVDDLRLGHILGRTVEDFPPGIVIHIEKPQRHPDQRPVRPVGTDNAARPDGPVLFRLGQKFQKHISVPGIHAVQDVISPLLKGLRIDPHQLVKLLIETDDIDVLFAVPAVEDHRPEHVVEHGVGEDVVVHEFTDGELLIGFEADPDGIHNGPVPDQIFKILRRHRPVEVVSLHVAAAQPLQEFQLRFGLDAFDNDRDREVLGHVDDGFEDVDAFFRAAVRDLQELGVQLDHVHVHIPQHVQGGITAPEIIHQHLESVVLQPGDGIAHQPDVVGVSRLRDLHLQAVRRQVIFLQQRGQLHRYIQCRNVQLRYVDRNGNQRFSVLLHVPLPPADRVPDIKIQLGNQAVFFQDRDKDSR